MRFLKNKIGRAAKNQPKENRSDDEVVPQKEIPKAPGLPEKVQVTPLQQTDRGKNSAKASSKNKKDESKPSSKNIVKNFGKAMCSFASSHLAMPYLERINSHSGGDVDLEDFQSHIHSKRDLIDSIDSLRSLLLITKNDDETLIGFKKIFQEISIIFIKYFSVNWIFQGKMSHKQAHLRSRFKMLRRIKSPQHFTYFKDFSR